MLFLLSCVLAIFLISQVFALYAFFTTFRELIEIASSPSRCQKKTIKVVSDLSGFSFGRLTQALGLSLIKDLTRSLSGHSIQIRTRSLSRLLNRKPSQQNGGDLTDVPDFPPIPFHPSIAPADTKKSYFDDSSGEEENAGRWRKFPILRGTRKTSNMSDTEFEEKKNHTRGGPAKSKSYLTKDNDQRTSRESGAITLIGSADSECSTTPTSPTSPTDSILKPLGFIGKSKAEQERLDSGLKDLTNRRRRRTNVPLQGGRSITSATKDVEDYALTPSQIEDYLRTQGVIESDDQD